MALVPAMHARTQPPPVYVRGAGCAAASLGSPGRAHAGYQWGGSAIATLCIMHNCIIIAMTTVVCCIFVGRGHPRARTFWFSPASFLPRRVPVLRTYHSTHVRPSAHYRSSSQCLAGPLRLPALSPKGEMPYPRSLLQGHRRLPILEV